MNNSCGLYQNKNVSHVYMIVNLVNFIVYCLSVYGGKNLIFIELTFVLQKILVQLIQLSTFLMQSYHVSVLTQRM